jgi:hypothetical protein
MIRSLWDRVVTPITVLTVAIVAMLAAVGGWIGIAIRTTSRIWPDRIMDLDQHSLWSELAVSISATVSAVLLFRYSRKLRRVRAGLCLKCGYDLRASTGRCPECGTPTQQPFPA